MFGKMRFVLCAAVLAAAAAAFISGVGADGALLLARPAAADYGRTLLKPCPVNLAAANYTVLTSRCPYPPFHPVPCCAAFKDLACPYAQYLNDLNTDCADILFRNIDRHGGYPPGIFFDNCKEGSKGLKCPNDQNTI